MYNVSNSKCIRRISSRSIKNNMTRNVISVIAIALTAVMITALFTIGASVVHSFQQSTMKQVGTSSHGGFKHISMEQYEKIKQDPKVKDISYTIIAGELTNDELLKTYTEFRYTEEKSAEWSYYVPTTGHLPKKGMELATTTDVLDALGVPHKLGAKVPLEFVAGGKAYQEEFTLCGFWKPDSAVSVNQAFISKEYCDKIAPAWDDEARAENIDRVGGSEGYIAGSVNPSLWFSTSWNIEKQMADLKARCGFDEDVNDGVNWAYTSSEVDLETILLVVGILLVIMVSGYLIIYNVFYISVSSDIRFYGLLKTIGTTGRQLTKIVRRQAGLLSLIGIPIGLVLGYLISIVLLPIVMQMMTIKDCEVTASPLIFIGSAAFAFITVWISCIKPCKLAKRISPIEAVRFAEGNSVEGQGKKRRGRRKAKGKNFQRKEKGKKARKVTALSLAWGNLGRTPKKTAAVVLSISLSLIILNGTVTLVKGFDMDKFIRSYSATDFYVTSASLLNVSSPETDYAAVSAEDAKALKDLAGVTDFGGVYLMENYLDLEGDLQKRTEAMYEKYAQDLEPKARQQEAKMYVYGEHFIPSHVYGVDEFITESMDILEGSVDWEKFASGKYVIAGTYEDKKDDKFYEVGEKVKIPFDDGSVGEYEVMAIGSIAYALGPQHSHTFNCDLILPADEFVSRTGQSGMMKAAFNVDEEHYEAAEDFLADYCETVNSDLDYRSKSTYVEEFEQMQNTFIMVGGALSLVLALIGILNFANGVITSINARRRELAVMQSIGMTGKQMKQMLAGEGLCHILLVAVVCLTVGNLAVYGMVKLVTGQMWFFTYHFSLVPVLVSLAVFALLAMLIPRLCYRIMCKTSVVDRLRAGE